MRPFVILFLGLHSGYGKLMICTGGNVLIGSRERIVYFCILVFHFIMHKSYMYLAHVITF